KRVPSRLAPKATGTEPHIAPERLQARCSQLLPCLISRGLSSAGGNGGLSASLAVAEPLRAQLLSQPFEMKRQLLVDAVLGRRRVGAVRQTRPEFGEPAHADLRLRGYGQNVVHRPGHPNPLGAFVG